MFESYAQNNEDVVLWRVLRDVEAGTYVDVGAADPHEDSVTKAFYERGWSGLNVEPVPAFAARLRDARQRDVVVQAAAGAVDGQMTLHLVPDTGLSSLVDASADSLQDTDYEVVDTEVEVRRLDALLEEHGFVGREIHFLKIDVEGFEESVLRGIDLSCWRPWIIVAEATAPRSSELVHASWEPILVDAGYRFCLFDGLNRFYVAQEHDDLRPLLEFPAGVFDQPFMSAPHARLLHEYENLLEGNQRLEALRVEALRSFDEVDARLARAVADFAELDATYHEAVAAYERIDGELRRSLESYAALEQRYESTVADYARLEAMYLQTVSDYEREAASAAGARAEFARVDDQRAQLAAERDTLRAGVAQMSAEYEGLRAQRDAAQTELSLIRQTLSWRVTKPLRAVRRLRAR